MKKQSIDLEELRRCGEGAKELINSPKGKASIFRAIKRVRRANERKRPAAKTILDELRKPITPFTV